MKNFFLLITVVLFLTACSSGNKNAELLATPNTDSTIVKKDLIPSQQTSVTNPIGKLKMGMDADSVIKLLGEPTRKETLESDAKTPMEDWWFGENQKVRMINGKVNHVVKDVAKEQELLKQLVAAKKKGDEAEVARLLDELTKQ